MRAPAFHNDEHHMRKCSMVSHGEWMYSTCTLYMYCTSLLLCSVRGNTILNCAELVGSDPDRVHEVHVADQDVGGPHVTIT